MIDRELTAEEEQQQILKILEEYDKPEATQTIWVFKNNRVFGDYSGWRTISKFKDWFFAGMDHFVSIKNKWEFILESDLSDYGLKLIARYKEKEEAERQKYEQEEKEKEIREREFEAWKKAQKHGFTYNTYGALKK